MEPSTGPLSDRVVAITGAGNGLGRAYAHAAAAAGASVIVADVDLPSAQSVADQIIARGRGAAAVEVDISRPGAGELIVSAARTHFGRLDGLVANAGILSPGPLLDQSPETVHRTIGVNVEGTISTVTAAARAMDDGGSIVVIVSGSMLGADGLALYGTTKAAALGLVYGLALELADTGVRINGLAPRARTGMSEQMGAAGEDKGGPAERVAPAVVYLLADDSRALQGHVLRFDGEHLAVFRPPRIAQEVSAPDWDATAIAAAMAGPLRDEIGSSLPGATRRGGADATDVLHLRTADSSKRLGAEWSG
ncbi:SDR family oxidoreductase [Microbacterium sp. Mu-80]|uniref:SDR family oxidoreductase n=1 Tax=Microbacterium bandirmense TaxID=3122050 RepID=A0ABU8LET5_9MICO